MKGSYGLLIYLDEDTEIEVGSLGVISFPKGYYLYIGSALNGIESRVKRHLGKEKKIHWHVDYLLGEAEVVEVFYQESSEREECIITGILQKHLKSIPGFGSSDCNCKGHLFHGDRHSLESLVKTSGMNSIKGMKTECIG